MGIRVDTNVKVPLRAQTDYVVGMFSSKISQLHGDFPKSFFSTVWITTTARVMPCQWSPAETLTDLLQKEVYFLLHTISVCRMQIAPYQTEAHQYVGDAITILEKS